MIPGIRQIVKRSIIFYRRPVLYQVLIIALLSAVITGSLLTGVSVKTSLLKSASDRLGNTDILISSGVRYFDPELVQRMKDKVRINCTGLLEINGYSQSLVSQKGAFNTHIYAVDRDFFRFHGNDSVSIETGEIAVNSRLAIYLGIKPGDELIIRFNEISDIPADAPFAPSKETTKSFVMRVGQILESDCNGNFSLSISQIIPMNIFINLYDIPHVNEKVVKINRLLIGNSDGLTLNEITSELLHVLKLSDIGLSLRKIKKTGEHELITDRVFIDSLLLNEIQTALPRSAPVITYLGNRFASGSRSTPYSFVSALPASIYPEIPTGDGIIINRWLADDLAILERDTITIFWYSPDSLNKLIESSSKFVVRRIVDMKGIWSDSLLMPDFPGISGSESCSDWDAGVPIKMDVIRHKDEDYWNRFKGTPKAFINYEMGKRIWGNNFGPATAIRFPENVSEKEIDDKLAGSLDPGKSGFIITDIYSESVKAANESIDFSTLFLSLGFFLILASIVLLSLSVTSYIVSKKGQMDTFFALGFTNRWIKRLLFQEATVITSIGCLIGSFSGCLVNILITKALNSVWRGAVQTDTLEAFFNSLSMLEGLLFTILFIMIFMLVKVSLYLKRLNRKEKEIHVRHSVHRNLLLLLTSFVIAVALFAFSFYFKDQELSLYFGTGSFLFITLILFWRYYFIRRTYHNGYSKMKGRGLSRLYYASYPSHAVTPILFIAAGIFAVFITGLNRMNLNDDYSDRSNGTGGYLLWCENTIPVSEDLNTASGKKIFGFDSGQFTDLSFVQIKRSSGNDASCLNLNHITSPPLLGIDPADFISGGSFSFAKIMPGKNIKNAWQFLNMSPDDNTIYGIADQTVLEWGLKIKPGDTLILRAENGQPLNVIIAAGLKSSLFQGYVLIGMDNFMKYYPSVAGTSIMLADGDPKLINIYKNALTERLDNYGVDVELTKDRLASFNEVTNTYLSVFGVFGALGMVIGIAGLGFVLLRNYNHRKREFALLMATGFTFRKIRLIILSEQLLILFAGITSGVVPAIVSTLPSLRDSTDLPWFNLFFMIFSIIITGLTVLLLSVRSVKSDSLTTSLKKE
jgi:putative ABC transport system permease protein